MDAGTSGTSSVPSVSLENNPPPTSTTTSLLPPPSASKLKLPSKIVSRDIKLPSFPTEAILAAASNPPSTVNSRLTTATQQQATEKTTISKKSGDMTSGNQPSQTEEFKVHTTTLKRKPESTTTASNRNTRARMDSASSTSTTASGPKRTGTVTSRLTKPTVASMNRVGKATSSTAKTATKAVEKDDDEGSSSGVPKKKKRPAWDVKGRLQDLEELHGATESRLADSNKVMTEMTSQLTESQKTIQELLLFRRSLETKVEMKEKENTHISTELSEMQTKLTSTVQRYTMEIQSLKTTHSIEINEAKMQFDALQRNFENLSNELQLSRQENAQLRSTISNHSTAMISLESDLRANKLMLEQTKDLLMTREGEIKVLEQKLADSMENCRNLEVKIREGESVRRRLHNSIQELKGNIRVFCRVRPLLPAELSDGKNPNEVLSHIAYPDVDNKAIELTQSAESGSGSSKPIQKNYPFAFDKVFQPSSTQAEVFEEISQLVQSALDGYHVCIFAYGQTGSGKTFTMEGPNNPDDMSMGMIPRAVLQIFETAQSLKDKGWEYTMEAQFLEIYNESIRDLLGNDDGTKKHDIKHLSTTKTTVTDVTTMSVTSPREVHSLLKTASRNRAVAATNCNERSSRSHSVFTLRLNGDNKLTGELSEGILNLIDLAGSERLSSSGSTGDRLKETQAINKSLSCLGDVIYALSNKDSHIPYRNSKLTYLLQNSLGGNSKTLMFVNVSPLPQNFQETLCSLRFATKVNSCQIGTARRIVK